MSSIVQVRSMKKMIMNYRERLNQVQSVMKTREDNEVTDRIGTVYVKNDIELS